MRKSRCLSIAASLCVFAWMHSLPCDVRDTDSLHVFFFFFFSNENTSIDPALFWLLCEGRVIPQQDSYTLKPKQRIFLLVSLKCRGVFAEVLGRVSGWGFMWYIYAFIHFHLLLLCWNGLLIHIIMSPLLSNQRLRAAARTDSAEWSMIWVRQMNLHLNTTAYNHYCGLVKQHKYWHLLNLSNGVALVRWR